MGHKEDKLAAIGSIQEAVKGRLNEGKPRLLSKTLFELLGQAVERDGTIGAQYSRASAASKLETSVSSNTFKNAVRQLAVALEKCRPDDPKLMPLAEDRVGVACIEADVGGTPHLAIVRGPTKAHRDPHSIEDDSLLRLVAEFRQISTLGLEPDCQPTAAISQAEREIGATRVAVRMTPAKTEPPNPNSHVAGEVQSAKPADAPSKRGRKANLRPLPSASRISRVPLAVRRFGALFFLLVCAACLYSFAISVTRGPGAVETRLKLSTVGDVHLRYGEFQHAGISPACGCENEVDPNDWWGISSLARHVILSRTGGPPYTKYLVTGAMTSSNIRWAPDWVKTTARIFVVKRPLGGEGFDPRLLFSGKLPAGYEIQTMEDVEEPFIYIITKGHVHVNMLGQVPVFAVLPMESSDVTVRRSHGAFASMASRLNITEKYNSWLSMFANRRDQDIIYEYPVVDFVGPDVVYWSDYDADVVTSHKAYRRPAGPGEFIVGVFVTKPPFASRVAAIPVTQAERDHDIAVPDEQFTYSSIDAPGALEVMVPDPIEQARQYSTVLSFARKHPILPVSAIPLISQEVVGWRPDKPNEVIRSQMAPGEKMQDEYRYPPLPPKAGLNVFGPLSAFGVDAAQGSITLGRSVEQVAQESKVELRSISRISRERGVLTLEPENNDAIRVDLRATGEVLMDAHPPSLPFSLQRLDRMGLVYLTVGLASLFLAILPSRCFGNHVRHEAVVPVLALLVKAEADEGGTAVDEVPPHAHSRSKRSEAGTGSRARRRQAATIALIHFRVGSIRPIRTRRRC